MKITDIKYGIALVLVLLATVFLFVAYAYGSVTFTVPTQQVNTYQNFSFFSATTTNATSTADGGGGLVITGAKKVTMYFTHGGVATTSTAADKFKIQTTQDGSTWDDFLKLIGADVSSTATSTYTIQGATSTVPVALDLSDDTFYAIRCISVEIAGAAATDGEHTCKASVEF